jgi:type II secretory pathway pseudopilin PulG
MGKFLLGLVIGLIVGVLAVTFSPSLAEDVRTGLASLAGLVMRGVEEAAEGVGQAADEVVDEAREAAGGEAERDPEAPAEPATGTGNTERPADETGPGSEPPRTE